jgi:hypothetical protein
VADADPKTFAELPAAPVGLFRDLRFCVSASSGAIFRTSGTTSGQRGAHHLPDTEAVELAARLHFDAMLPGCPTADTISLVTDANEHPDSSLGHMIRQLAPGARGFFKPGVGVDTDGAWAALRGASAPVFVPTTAFALAELLERPGEARLPSGSVVMVTGGFKGRRTQLDEAGLWAEARRRLGPDARLVGEYGMTELSSQLWDVGEGLRPAALAHRARGRSRDRRAPARGRLGPPAVCRPRELGELRRHRDPRLGRAAARSPAPAGPRHRRASPRLLLDR